MFVTRSLLCSPCCVYYALRLHKEFLPFCDVRYTGLVKYHCDVCVLSNVGALRLFGFIVTFVSAIKYQSNNDYHYDKANSSYHTSDDLLLYDWVGRGGVCDVHKVTLVDWAGLDGVGKDGGLLITTHIFPQLPFWVKLDKAWFGILEGSLERIDIVYFHSEYTAFKASGCGLSAVISYKEVFWIIQNVVTEFSSVGH